MDDIRVLICRGYGQDPLVKLTRRITMYRDLETASREGATDAEASYGERVYLQGLEHRYAGLAEADEKFLTLCEQQAKSTIDAAAELSYRLVALGPSDWERLKARIDGVCMREDCHEPTAAEDFWNPDAPADLRFELCREHTDEVLESDAVNAFVAAQKESA